MKPSNDSNWSDDPDANRTTQEFILSRGFSYEDHYVTTKDGYILHLFRIINPYAEHALGADNLHPVLLQHGLFATSSVWMLNSFDEKIIPWVHEQKSEMKGNSLAFLLSNSGYDVWLANNRGNSYSQNHTTLDPEDDEFWDFTIDDMAMQDTSAVIDYIRYLTDKKITVIGHSFGTTQVLALLSFAPHYSYYIDMFIALGPIGYFGNVKGPFGKLLDSSLALDIVGLYDGKFPPKIDRTIKNIFTSFCENPSLRVICTAVFDMIGGMNPDKIDESRLGVYFNNIDYVSMKTVEHLFQAKESNIWRLFDHDEDTNNDLYGYETPPKYPYSNIDLDKIILISGLNDRIASTDDVQQLRKKLKSKIFHDYIVSDKRWNHFDYIYGIDAGEQVNNYIVNVLTKYVEHYPL
ncbi:lipase member K-like isoform X2 [Tetranychus urticae]|nr:lipase member K-like isoform X2 [Tetranychus urticae]XP_025017566.1 lipase member K-like isoform X2 [Tetranychus urticae]